MSSPYRFPFSSLDLANPENMQAWLQKILDSFPHGILIIDESGRIHMANAAAHELFDVPPSSPLDDVTRFLSSENAKIFGMYCERVLREERHSSRCEEIFPLGDDDKRWARCSFTALPEQEGGRKLVLVTLSDVSAERAALEQHALSAQRYRDLFDAAPDAMMVIAPQGTLLDLNKMACERINKTRDELLEKHIQAFFTSARQHCVTVDLEKVLEHEVQHTFEALLVNPDNPIPVEINARLVNFHGQPAVLGIARDITERKLLQARLEYQASTDSLTALNNRRNFLSKAEQEFERFKRYGNTFALLVLDLDFFKRVNDTYGHQAGDELLRDFARQMRVVFRRSDVIGRTGGEEFTVLLHETGLHLGIESAERLRRHVEKRPLQIANLTVPYTVSIGVTIPGMHDADLEVIIRRADAAMYRAKLNGRNQVEYNAPDSLEHLNHE